MSSPTITQDTEAIAIKERYTARDIDADTRYSLLDPYSMMAEQEKDRNLVRWLKESGVATRLKTSRILEIGCGSGANLARFIRLGFPARHLTGNDLLPQRIEAAKRTLPSDVTLLSGDARFLELPEESLDVVCAYTVFSSILDDSFQESLAQHIWSLVKPGGGVLWYDFTYDNPRNKNVRGVTKSRVRQLFPDSSITFRRLTLAPPLGRIVSKISPSAYSILNIAPLLRTHLHCWIRKVNPV